MSLVGECYVVLLHDYLHLYIDSMYSNNDELFQQEIHKAQDAMNGMATMFV